jgi:hypothetical protein
MADDENGAKRPKTNVDLLKESGDWDKLSPLQQRMSYEAMCSSQMSPEVAKELKDFHDRLDAYDKTDECKKAKAELRAIKQSQIDLVKQYRDRAIASRKEIFGDDYDASKDPAAQFTDEEIEKFY